MFSFEDASKYGKEAMDNMLKSYSTFAQGMQAMTTEATDYSKKAYEGNTAVIEKMFGAKSFEKAFEIQSEYAKSAYEDFVAQATKMSEMYVDFTRKAFEPFEEAAKTVAPPAQTTKKAA